MMSALLFALLSACALSAPLERRVGSPDKMCKPEACFTDCVGDAVHLEPYPVNISRWDNVSKSYTHLGTVMSHALKARPPPPGTKAPDYLGGNDEFGIFLHGPLLRQEDNKNPNTTLPPIYFSSSFGNKVYRLDDVPKGQNTTGNWSGSLTLMGTTAAPSTTWPVTDGPGGKTKGFFIGEGNPFYMNMLNGSMSIRKGGVEYMSKDQSTCTTMFPNAPLDPYDGLGQVVNTVQCHEPSGMCFFSVWKFYDQSIGEKIAPDCLYWCNPDDMHNPTECISMGKVKDENGKEICTAKGTGPHLGGAVHGFTVGNTDPDDQDQFDLLLVFTGGAGFDKGYSHMQKLKMKVLLDGVQTISSTPFAVDLWNATVQEPHDVGLDHAWVDATRELVWVTSFRESNPGIHMVDYATGDLKLTISGFHTFFPGQFTYPAGVSGIGTFGTEGSMLTIATSTQKGLTVPPIMKWGKTALFVIDISKMLTSDTYKCVNNQCVIDPAGGALLHECQEVCGH